MVIFFYNHSVQRRISQEQLIGPRIRLPSQASALCLLLFTHSCLHLLHPQTGVTCLRVQGSYETDSRPLGTRTQWQGAIHTDARRWNVKMTDWIGTVLPYSGSFDYWLERLPQSEIDRLHQTSFKISNKSSKVIPLQCFCLIKIADCGSHTKTHTIEVVRIFIAPR